MSQHDLSFPPEILNDPLQRGIARARIKQAREALRCREEPKYFLDQVSCIDAKTGEPFEFHCTDPESGWYWQGDLIDWLEENEKIIVLKARQLGVTWLFAGYGLWTALFKPGSRVLVFSVNELEASKVINRIWDMLQSLPKHLWNGAKVIKPAKGSRPYTEIQLEFPDGRVSAIIGLPSTKRAGQGETAAFVLLDEFSRQDYASETWKSVLPTMAGGGRIAVVSTGNGVSNPVTGEGNFFHHLWDKGEAYRVAKKFLAWDLHPDRDQKWYLENAMSLPARDRAEQYPLNPHEAFILTGDLYFDQQALAYYTNDGLRQPKRVGRFYASVRGGSALFEVTDFGPISIFTPPKKGRDYAIGADVSTGRAGDFSAAYVVDLTNMELVAELHGKLDADVLATQLHFLGRYYNTARIAIETGGGYGEAPIIFLRDGREGRPSYPKMYRHRQESRPDHAEHKPFGFPMNTKTRPLVLEHMEKCLRERSIPYLSDGLLSEISTFVNKDTNPSPRAQDGCNDDRVMACAITLEMYRQYGRHERRVRRQPSKRSETFYPWQRPKGSLRRRKRFKDPSADEITTYHRRV